MRKSPGSVAPCEIVSRLRVIVVDPFDPLEKVRRRNNQVIAVSHYHFVPVWRTLEQLGMLA